MKIFQTSELGKILAIDKSKCLKGRITNTDHLFTLFGEYSGDDSDNVREDMQERLQTGARVYNCVGQIFLARHNQTYEDWLKIACSVDYYGDELLLYALCRVFHRHAVIVCNQRYWSTVEPEGQMEIQELLDVCDLHFIYLRPGIFAELRPKKRIRMRKPSPPEFPHWSASGDHDHDNMRGAEEFVNSPLLQMYLNCKTDGDIQSEDNMSVDFLRIQTENNNETAPKIPIDSTSNTTNEGNVYKDTGTTPSTVTKEGNIVLATDGCNVDDTISDEDQWLYHMDTPAAAHPIALNSSTPDLINPISLKECCTQVLLRHCEPTTPPSLFQLCMDIIAWDPIINYPCSLVLPRTIATHSHIIELLNMKPKVKPRQATPMVHVHNNIYVEQEVYELWLADAKSHTYEIPLNKLTEANVALWKKPDLAWQDIDPYSSLEDVGDNSSSEHAQEMDKRELNQQSESLSEPETSYDLRDRKKRRSNLRSVKCKSYKKYYGDLDLDMPASPKKCRKLATSACSGPSKERIAARGRRTQTPAVSHLIPRKRALKSETKSDSDATLKQPSENEEAPDDSGTDSDPDDNIPLSKLKSPDTTENKSAEIESSSRAVRKVFVTRSVGLKKFRRKRYYSCPVCNEKFNLQGHLNSHYREKHDKVKCSKCQEIFTTPCTLQRHMYTHRAPRVFCRCGEGFYFNADLRIHKLTHRRICTQICAHPGCNCSYYSASELSKHVLIHKNISWNCSRCEYTTKDKCLLKSHQRKHDQTPHFFCTRCAKGFMYHTQWSRHKEANNCVAIKRSSSPDL